MSDTVVADLTARRRRISRINRALRALPWEQQPVDTFSALPHPSGGTTYLWRLLDTDAAGGLAVHRSPNYDAATGAFDTWTVTHAQSGFAVMQHIPTERKARVVAVRLLALPVDWSQSQEQLRGQFEPWRKWLRLLYDDVYCAGSDDEEVT